MENNKTTILVVDDERIIRELCERALREYNVLLATTSDEALQIYETGVVDLVLSDVMMPGDSGIMLLKKIKALDPNATVVIMTGFSDKGVILDALREDADDFISKPLNLLQLKTAIDKSLKRKVLKEQLTSIKRADRLKSNFLSLVSHKLRTPITGISLSLQNAQKWLFDCDEIHFRQNIELAVAETEYLANLVTDLLRFSQIMVDEQDIHREECDLVPLVAELLAKRCGTDSKRSIEVDFNPESLPLLKVDRRKIEFALDQLLENAFKFFDGHSHASVNVSTKAENGVVSIVISDTGIGIPQSELEKVFEKFYQIDPDNTGQVRGFGLGLFYAREFVRLHGGTISIDSEPEQGTTVTVAIPLQ
ncbi:MAG: ATP-binding protein [Desulfuromonadales bacterium]